MCRMFDPSSASRLGCAPPFPAPASARVKGGLAGTTRARTMLTAATYYVTCFRETVPEQVSGTFLVHECVGSGGV